MYLLALQELGPLGLKDEIIIGREITEEALTQYDAHLHENEFPPKSRDEVRELAGDGHEKVLLKCQVPPMKRSGRPRGKKAKKKNWNNGWFMITHPKSKRIVSIVEQCGVHTDR